MNNWPPFVPYLILAAICGIISIAIMVLWMMILANGGHTSDVGTIAMGGMVAAPAIMGIGIAGFMSQDKR